MFIENSSTVSMNKVFLVIQEHYQIQLQEQWYCLESLQKTVQLSSSNESMEIL
jgi:hypothetical protein